MKKFWAWFWGWPTRTKFAAFGVLCFIVFGFLNDTMTTIDVGFGEVVMPQYVALLLAAGLGFLPGVAAGHWFARREARRRAAFAAAEAQTPR